jgi:hypothetical protein
MTIRPPGGYPPPNTTIKPRGPAAAFAPESSCVQNSSEWPVSSAKEVSCRIANNDHHVQDSRPTIWPKPGQGHCPDGEG